MKTNTTKSKFKREHWREADERLRYNIQGFIDGGHYSKARNIVVNAGYRMEKADLPHPLFCERMDEIKKTRGDAAARDFRNQHFDVIQAEEYILARIKGDESTAWIQRSRAEDMAAQQTEKAAEAAAVEAAKKARFEQLLREEEQRRIESLRERVEHEFNRLAGQPK